MFGDNDGHSVSITRPIPLLCKKTDALVPNNRRLQCDYYRELGAPTVSQKTKLSGFGGVALSSNPNDKLIVTER